MAFCRRSPITLNNNTKPLIVYQSYMCTKFQQDISNFTEVTACTDERTDGQTDSHSEFNSSHHPNHFNT